MDTKLVDANKHLQQLAIQISQEYIRETSPRAVLLTGSVALRQADDFSDLDMILYYDELPTKDQLSTIRTALNASSPHWAVGERDKGKLIEAFYVSQVECQLAFFGVKVWQDDMSKVLDQCELDLDLQKALEGLIKGQPLHGHDLIEQWKESARSYPDHLRQIMIKHHLDIFPLWAVAEAVEHRDATIFEYEMLVQSTQRILAILAGINRQYFSPYQFKNMSRFIDQLQKAPDDLSSRIESLFDSTLTQASQDLKRIVEEVIDLVKEDAPEIDISPLQNKLALSPRKWR